MKKFSLLTSLIVMISFILSIFKSTIFDLITFLDTLFICSLALTLLGASMHILNAGFFDAYSKQFKSFLRQINRTEQYMSEFENTNNDFTPRFYEFSSATFFTLTGIILTLLSGIFSVVVF